MKKTLKIIILALIICCLCVPMVYANNDLFQASDENLTVEEELDGTSFLASNILNVRSPIKGIGFLAARTVTYEGNSEYLFGAGETVYVNGKVSNDAFLAGKTISLSNTEIGRDLYAAASSIVMNNSVINRNVMLAAKTVTINGTINGNLKIEADNIEIGKNAIINGILEYDQDTTIAIAGTAKIANTVINPVDAVVNESGNNIKDEVVSQLWGYVMSAVIAIIIVLIAPKLAERMNKMQQTAGHFFKNSAIGLLSLIIVPIVSIILMITVIGLPVGIIGILLYILAIYLAPIAAAYMLGNLVWTKLYKKNPNKYVNIFLGLALIAIFEFIPVVSAIVVLFKYLFGIGLIYELLRNKK